MKVLVELETEDIAILRECIENEKKSLEACKLETKRPDKAYEKIFDSLIKELNAILAKLTF